MVGARFKKYGFNLLELMVVIAISGLILSVAVPIYKTETTKVAITRVANKLGTLNMQLADTYSATGSWPTTMNGVAAQTTGNSTFANTSNFNYTTSGNKAVYGYQLSAAQGYGWIFMTMYANDDGTFVSHCGIYNDSCSFGACDSYNSLPAACSEVLTSAGIAAPSPYGSPGASGGSGGQGGGVGTAVSLNTLLTNPPAGGGSRGGFDGSLGADYVNGQVVLTQSNGGANGMTNNLNAAIGTIQMILQNFVYSYYTNGSFPSSFYINGYGVSNYGYYNGIGNYNHIQGIYYQISPDGKGVSFVATINDLSGIPGYVIPQFGDPRGGNNAMGYSLRIDNGVVQVVNGINGPPCTNYYPASSCVYPAYQLPNGYPQNMIQNGYNTSTIAGYSCNVDIFSTTGKCAGG